MILDLREVARMLGGTVSGSNVMAPGPGHSRADRSLSIRIDPAAPEGFLVFSFAGDCPISCRDHVRAVLGLTGLGRTHKGHRPSRAQRTSQASERQPRWSSTTAFRRWKEASNPRGTVVESYLRSRGIDIEQSTSIRCHAGLLHPSGSVWPAMVGLVTSGPDDTPLAIHRTYLARDGRGKASVEPQKMMLGPCRGGAVRLAARGDVLMVGEGIESCLAAMQATGHPAWAALSTSGLRALNLSEDVTDVIILADGDDAGEAAARDCAWRWKREGRRVRIARPPRGMDFNDMLMDSALRIEEGEK